MLTRLKNPGFNPWSKFSGWDKFGDTYDSIDFKYKSLSEELLSWLQERNLSFAGGSMFTVFPDKTPAVVIDSPWCNQDNHARLYGVYEAPIKYTWYEVTEQLGEENFEKLLGVKPQQDEDSFTSKFTGWYPKPELLKQVGEDVVQAGEFVLVNAGSPILGVAASPVRSKVFAITVERANKVNPMYRTMHYDQAKEFLKEDLCTTT
jgi:hypothetical protein